MIDPDQLARLAQRLVERYRDAELAAFALVARRLAKRLDSEEWAAYQQLQATGLSRDARRIVEVLAKGRDAEVAALVTAAAGVGAREAALLLADSAAAGSPPSALAALTRDLAGRLAAADLRILRATDDVFRQVIARVTAQGLAGEYTRRQAAQAALNLFSGRGITGFVDAAGRQWNLASYAEMACRTAANGAARQGTFDRMRAAGRDLAVIGGSSSGCELCSDWEGEVVSLDGVTPGYPTLAEAEGAGLFHPNCTHQPYPYVPGLTQTSGIARSDAGTYEARQQQRYLERGIRAWKTRQAVALDDAAARAAQAKVREWQARLREHVGGQRPEAPQLSRADRQGNLTPKEGPCSTQASCPVRPDATGDADGGAGGAEATPPQPEAEQEPSPGARVRADSPRPPGSPARRRSPLSSRRISTNWSPSA